MNNMIEVTMFRKHFFRINLKLFLFFCGLMFSLIDSGNADNTSRREIELKRHLKAFDSSAVAEYVKQTMVLTKVSTMASTDQPKEYKDVIRDGKLAVPYLVDYLKSQKKGTSIGAWWALIEITNKQFGRNEYAKWEEWWRRNEFKSRTQWFIDDLTSEDEVGRKNAAIYLGEIGDKKAIPALRKALDDPEIKFYVTESLGELEDKSAIPYLIELYLSHDNFGYRKIGIDLLKKLTGESLGYDPNGSLNSRKKSIENWRKWWIENK